MVARGRMCVFDGRTDVATSARGDAWLFSTDGRGNMSAWGCMGVFNGRTWQHERWVFSTDRLTPPRFSKKKAEEMDVRPMILRPQDPLVARLRFAFCLFWKGRFLFGKTRHLCARETAAAGFTFFVCLFVSRVLFFSVYFSSSSCRLVVVVVLGFGFN